MAPLPLIIIDVLTIGVLMITVIMLMLLVFQRGERPLRKVGPKQALVVYGAGGTKVFMGGWHVIKPLVQRAYEVSLELMSFDVTPSQYLYTREGITINIEAVIQIKVRSDEESIKTAVEHFLSKRQEERENLIRLIVEGHLRSVVGHLTVEDLVKDRENARSKILKAVTPDLEKLIGLEAISFTIKDAHEKIEDI